jgi:hypothetical protein
MEYLSFETQDNFDFDFLGDEDFGLAKSFTDKPLHQIAPLANFQNTHEDSVERLVDHNVVNEIRADGFCFKLAPTEDQVQF